MFPRPSSLSFQFVVTNQLGVRANGLGTISPNYSNAWLEIGRNYSITSTPASGFKFTNWLISTNWLGGLISTNKAVQFMMASNLTLQVTFVDTNQADADDHGPDFRPAHDQRAGQRERHGQRQLGHDQRVVSIEQQRLELCHHHQRLDELDGDLDAGGGHKHDSKAYAVDLGANLSATNTVSFVSSNTFTLQLGFAAGPPLSGNGLSFDLQISPGLNGRIEASTNLMDWVTLTNFVGTNAIIHIRDTAATNLNQRFYRAVTP